MTTNANITNVKYVKSENEFAVYSNQIGVAITPFDIRLLFGLVDAQMEQASPQTADQAQPTQEMTVVKLGSVNLSPGYAKVVCAALEANIAQYEKLFGTINVPPNMIIPHQAKG